MSVAELEAALLANPEDDALLAVYADALHAAGDPRGELAEIQRQRAAADTPELAIAEDALLARHGDDLLGLLGDRRVRPEANDRRLEGAAGIAGYTLAWRGGHVRSVVISEPYGARPGPGEVMRSLLARPAARFLERVALEDYDGFATGVTYEASERHRRRGREVVEAIAAAPRPTLRSISLGISDIRFEPGGEYENRDALTHAGCELGALDKLWSAAPRLEHVLLSGCSAKLGGLDLPELRSFEMRQSFMTHWTLREIATAQLPKLESLVVWLGAADYGEIGYTTEDLAPLCDPARFPALRTLGFVCADATAAIASMVLRSPIMPQLRRLDLRGGTLSSVAPFREATAWHHLDELDLRWNPLFADLPAPAILEPRRTWDHEVPRFNACQE